MVSSHLFANRGLVPYCKSIDDLEQLCFSDNLRRYVMIGVDAQDVIGPSSSDDAHVLGEWAENGRGYKGELFLRFCIAHDLRLLNTFDRDPLGQFTCHYYLKKEPRQVDYVCSNLPPAARVSCRIHESTATLTDHRALLAEIQDRQHDYEHGLSIAPNSSKPIGWRCTDAGYNNIVRTSLNLPTASFCTEPPSSAYHVYTDGSCYMKRRKVVSAGWGFVTFPFGEEPSDTDMPELEAFGPVVVDQTSVNYLGARGLTNNTAELSGVVEFLLWVMAKSQECPEQRLKEGRRKTGE